MINAVGAVLGYSVDTNNLSHGFLWTPDGKFTWINGPGAGTGVGQGTQPSYITPWWEIGGPYFDSNNVAHGFLGSLDGRVHEDYCAGGRAPALAKARTSTP
jgi:probable HAF family extracellular repeat protein